MKRIGIYAGTFNPVHAGHIAFALQALKLAKLDRLYFLPERKPPNKTGVEHFGHRVAMLERAIKPHPKFEVLELVDISFSVQRTLPQLQQLFENSQLVFLFGSDIAPHLSNWPNADRLLASSEVVIGLRQSNGKKDLEQAITSWPLQPETIIVIDSYAPEVSSQQVREALRRRHPAPGLLKSVERYSDRHWLYVSLA